MARKFYVGVIERDPNDSFGVFFPDLPGCVAAGSTVEETIEDGKLALAQHIEAMADHGIEIPEPKGPQDFDQDEWEGSDVVSLVSFPVETGVAITRSPPVRLNISFPQRLAERVDAAAAEFGFDRSGLLAIAARQWLNQNVKRFD